MMKFPVDAGRVFARALGGLLMLLLFSGCDSHSDGGQVEINQPGGVALNQPGFFSGRAVNLARLQARIQVVANGVSYFDEVVDRPVDGTVWLSNTDILVPQGSDATLSIVWSETGVPGLPAELDGVLLLATYSDVIASIGQNLTLEIGAEDYVVGPTEVDLQPDLDIDRDGYGNLEELLAGSNPNNPGDIPADTDVTIVYHPTAPVIDGSYDSIWNLAQFEGRDGELLSIDKVLIDKSVVVPGENRGFRWAGMHDGESLYLLVFGEAAPDQAPFGDSTLAYNDDAIDIYWDGNNSKGAAYDGVDDFHAIIALLSTLGPDDDPNRTGIANTRFELGDRSRPIDISAFQFAVCLCTGERQIYEVKIDLQAARIPIGSPFGFEIQVNNDVDGGERDAKWAWHNDSGIDDTWRFPLRMGTAFLEPAPVL